MVKPDYVACRGRDSNKVLLVTRLIQNYLHKAGKYTANILAVTKAAIYCIIFPLLSLITFLVAFCQTLLFSVVIYHSDYYIHAHCTLSVNISSVFKDRLEPKLANTIDAAELGGILSLEFIKRQ